MSLSGAESWPPGVCLKYVGGDQFGHVNMVMARSLDPQEMADVSVQMRSPVAPGMYQGQWRMCTATGLFYGGEELLQQSFFWRGRGGGIPLITKMLPNTNDSCAFVGLCKLAKVIQICCLICLRHCCVLLVVC